MPTGSIFKLDRSEIAKIRSGVTLGVAPFHFLEPNFSISSYFQSIPLVISQVHFDLAQSGFSTEPLLCAAMKRDIDQSRPTSEPAAGRVMAATVRRPDLGRRA